MLKLPAGFEEQIYAGGNNTNTLTLGGRQSDVNRALEALIYTGQTAEDEDDVLTIASSEITGGPELIGAPQDIPNANSVVLEDFDKDGDLDLVAAGKNDDNTIADVVFYKRHLGSNKFSNVAVLESDINAVESVIAVDVDGDTWVDIVMTRRGSGKSAGTGLYWFRNQCEGEKICYKSKGDMFGEAPRPIETDTIWFDIASVVAGDFNKDGRQDLVVAA